MQGALSAGHQHTKVAGSATACVMQLDPENKTLEAANLVRLDTLATDCCLIVSRNHPSSNASPPHTHTHTHILTSVVHLTLDGVNGK